MELSLLLALRGGSSSFSHIVLISELWPRCGRVKAAGVPALSPPRLRSECPVQSEVAFVSPRSLVPPLHSHLSCSLSSPAFRGLLSLQQEDSRVWEAVVFLPLLFQPPPPLPRAIVADRSFVCVLRLLLKIKNSPFHPLYCFLVGCPCHSFSFMSSLDI